MCAIAYQVLVCAERRMVELTGKLPSRIANPEHEAGNHPR